MALSNGDKTRHGTNAQIILEQVLRYCLDKGYIVEYTADYRDGKEGYTNKKQFYAPFLIAFEDGEEWAIYSTTSMRTDRVKGQQWDAFNLKMIRPSIKKAILTYENGLSEKDDMEFKRQDRKYVQDEEFSAIDRIISHDLLCAAIERKATANLSAGQAKDIVGRNFEERVAEAMNSAANLEKWKTKDPTAVGLYFEMFETIANALGLDPQNTIKIEATSDIRKIKKLPSGGNPKTDVLIMVYKTTGMDFVTISCKRSSDAVVSVHQYTADKFARVLDADNETLRELLAGFQSAGSMKAFGEENCDALENEIKPYNEKLSLWVLGGIYGDGDPQTQWVTHILTYKNEDGSFALHTVQEYYQKLLDAGVQGSFGTLFGWTYPSKRRGETIQLKVRVI